MTYIDLTSVGSTVTNEGLVFPIDCSEAPETASEAEDFEAIALTEEEMNSPEMDTLIAYLLNGGTI